MNCAESIELLSDYHAGELDDGKETGVSTHLEKCPPCSVVYTELTVIVETASMLRSDDKINYPDEYVLWRRISLTKTAV
ncbi:MAG: zf-HC2 domain-containing protein [Pyrinomonadaceae bacterium]|nr:zf-HC2 domain-containing protein [Pyrinomonadaceae bacterium]